MSIKSAQPEVAYRALANDLREAIRAGQFGEGVRMPTEEQLVRDRGLSRQTVRRAFQDLVSEGLIYRVRGRGTFARRSDARYLRQFGSIDDLMGLSLDTEMELLVSLHSEVNVTAAELLGVTPDQVMTAAFRRWHSGTAFCATRVYVPQQIGRPLLELSELTQVGLRSKITVIGMIDQTSNLPITDAEQSITAARLPRDVAEQLDVAHRIPTLRIDRTYFNADGLIVESARSYFLPEHYTYRVRLQRSIH
jgi:GntR family transcriptional regulator